VRVARIWLILLVAGLIAACGGQPAAPGTPPTAAPAAASFEQRYRSLEFEQIAAAAQGGTVNWFMWGGSDAINSYVNGYVAATLKERYDITLRQVPVSDIAETVNKVLAEKQAGKDSGGSVDLIWINGENFRTLKEGGGVFRNWADLLPSSQFVDWENPAIANDFGFPVEYDESPWGSAQFVMEYDSATVPNPPKTIDELIAWACANPGRFTYPAPPDFTGSVFVRHVFYAAAGDHAQLLGPFDEATYAPIAERTWEKLDALRPCLWRNGETYPESSSALYDLFSQGEVWIAMNYSPTHAANQIATGAYPETARTWVFDTGTIANTNYLAIPFNSPNKAAAMVAADFLLSPEAQYEAARPEVVGWSTPLSFAKLPKEWVDKFYALPRPAAVLPADELASKQLPELQAPWLTRIEEDWVANVLER
jgi:putative spermidine/putrescine transport system substrate-binding protein